MNNSQIVTWIVKNRIVYFQDSSNSYSFIEQRHHISSVISQLRKFITHRFVAADSLYLPDIGLLELSFAPSEKNTKPNLRFTPAGGLASNLVSPSPKLHDYNIDWIGYLASLIIRPFQEVFSIVINFIKAINDLVELGKSVAVDLGCCKLTIAHQQVAIYPYWGTLAQIRKYKMEIAKQTYYKLSRATKHDNISSKNRWLYCVKGNFYKYPNLQEIHTHLERGLALQLQLMQEYD